MTIVEETPAAAGNLESSLTARKAMIDSQLRTSGVNADWVLQRMMAVPRENYLPANARAHAYVDRAVPLANGRKMAAPVVHGMMLQESRPTVADKVLLVDGGSGYLPDLIRPLVGQLDVVSAAEAAADSRKKGDFTLLVVDGAIEELPAGLTRRVAENGRVVTGLLLRGVTRLAAGRKVSGEITLLPLAEIGMPVLEEFSKPKGWSF